MSRHSTATRTALLALAGFALGACASTHRSVAAPSSVDTSPPVDATSRPSLSPIPTRPPDTVQGPLTTQLPAGVTAVTVSFVAASSSLGVVYRTTVTSPTGIRTLVDAVDALHVTGSYTKGCAPTPVDLRLDFTSPGHASSFVEDSSCRYATLTIDGVAGAKLDSAELGVAEQVVGVTAVVGSDGQPSISAAPSSSAA